jgi:hypothetical protein
MQRIIQRQGNGGTKSLPEQTEDNRPGMLPLVRFSTVAWKWLSEALTEQSIWVSRTDGNFPHTTR